MPPKLRTVYVCLRCGREHPRWVKRCAACQGSVKEKTVVEEGR